MLSVVVPVYNEQEVLEETHAELTETMDAMGESYELIFVDDGSRDESPAILENLRRKDERVSVISFSRNFGHEIANAAGLHYARGDAVILIDADLQDPPDLIPRMVAKWRDGNQVVYGVRRSRAGETGPKRATSYLFYSLISRISDTEIPRNVGDFRLMDRQVVDVFRQMREYHPFFRGMISWCGFRQTGIEFDRRPRAKGTSKYPYFRLTKLAFDTITSFSTLPLRALTYFAGLVMLGSVGFVVAVGMMRLRIDIEPMWWLLGAMGFCTGLVLGAVALVGEYVLRMHAQTQRRPLYVIDEIRGPIAASARERPSPSGVWPGRIQAGESSTPPTDDPDAAAH